MTSIALQHSKYGFASLRTYIAAGIFIIGNIVVPQLCHLIPNGGLMLLPIYFFTLIGAYKCGWKVGLLTAVLSPLVNCALFGMPRMTFEFIMTGDFLYALQDVRIGWPGIAIQIVGGYFLLKAIEKW